MLVMRQDQHCLMRASWQGGLRAYTVEQCCWDALQHDDMELQRAHKQRCIPHATETKRFTSSCGVETAWVGHKPCFHAFECVQMPTIHAVGQEGGEAGQATWGPPALEARRHVRGLGLQVGSAAAAAARFRRRQPPAATELLYVSDGDGNGVCRHLGTGYGRHSWVNPMLAGHVQARASSIPPCLWWVTCHVCRRQAVQPSSWNKDVGVYDN